MLSVSKVKSTAKTTQYLAKDDYYASNDPNHQKFSKWYGEGAKELGLEGSVVAEDFRNVLDGKLSNGQVIGVQKGLNVIHDPGRDLTFSAPKSVSIMALVYEDHRLIEAHSQAVKNALDEIEKNYLKTRFKKNGEITLEKTGKMVAAMFKHELSRDLDPQLHTHAIIANVTVNEKGKWRSAFFDEIYDNKKFLGLIYRSELARLVKDLGYEIEHKGKECLFEIKGVPNNLIDLFSNRSKTIRALADENSTQKELEKITVRSRQNKSVDEYEHNLSGDWKQKAKELLPSFDRQIGSLIKSVEDPKNLEETKNPKENPNHEAVEFAVTHLSERKSVFSRNEIISAALNDTLSKSTLSEIIKAVDLFTKQKTLLPVRRAGLEKNTYTTAVLLEKENKIIQLMLDGKDKHQAAVLDLSKYSDKLAGLNDGQKRSAELILTTKDMVTGIQGFAGTGKTTMIKTINEIFRAEGKKILGLSPTGVATRNLSTVGNIESKTLQRFLLQYDGVANGRGTKQGRIEMQQKFEDRIVLVDESSMISTNQMKDLLTISGELKFKLILVGDRRQLDSVEAGVPFYEMLRNGMPFTDMREILRQKNDNLKAAVYSVIKRDIGKAFKELEGSVIETKDVAHSSVEQFMAKSADHRKDTIVLTPANETREQVNKEISKALYKERVREERSKEYLHEIYKNKNLSEADKTRAYRFKTGDVVHFSKDRDLIGVKRNTYCEVTKIDTKENLITIKTGVFSTKTFNPIKLKGKAEKNYFEVFVKEQRIFYEGDKVAFNRSIPELGIVNSDNAVLRKVGLLNFYLNLESGKRIKISKKSPEAKLLDHAYAVTAHKAQGLTRKYVIAACESYRDELTTQKNFYVEISRAEQEVIIVTDDKQKIIEKLKENTGIEISAREHQDVNALGINMVGSLIKKKAPSNLKSQPEKSQDKSSPTESKKTYIHDYHPQEIKERFLGLTIVADDKEKVLERLEQNTGVKIGTREHQGAEELGINMIGGSSKKEASLESRIIEQEPQIKPYKTRFSEAKYGPNFAFNEAKKLESLQQAEQFVENSKIKETVFHGSLHDFDKFDESFLGSNTKTSVAKQGFFFTNNVETANDFMQFAEGKNSGNKGIIKCFKLNLNNPLIIDQKGITRTRGDYNNYILQAKFYGHDAIVIRNTVDTPYDDMFGGEHYPGNESDVFIVFDKNKILDLTKLEMTNDEKIPEIKNSSTSKKVFAYNFDKSEIKEHFLGAIKSGITLEAKDTEIAIDKALAKKSDKIRFGSKKEYEVCWHGEAGYVKNYKTGEYFDWGLNSIKEGRKVVEMSKEDRERKQVENKAARAKQEKQKTAEEKAVAEKAKKYFEGFFKASLVNTSQNKYLQRKGISQKIIEGVKFTKDDKLVVPVHDTKGVVQSLQFIDGDGKKTFLTGGKKMGNFFMIDSAKMKDSKEIYLAEGFATGVSIHMATNKPVAITFDAGNIEHVLKNLKEAHPNKEFTIAADNDLWKDHNVGKEKAEFAAQKYGAKVIVPNFSIAHKNELPTDFNDLHKLLGIHEVQRQIESPQIVHEHHHDLQI